MTGLVVSGIASGKIKSPLLASVLINGSSELPSFLAGSVGEVGNTQIESKLNILNPKKYDSSKITRDYTIKKGDTLAAIAKANNRTVKGIAHQNKIKDSDNIKVGQKIKL